MEINLTNTELEELNKASSSLNLDHGTKNDAKELLLEYKIKTK